MKIAVSLFPLVFGAQGPCRIGTKTRQECQLVCDATSFCDAWSYKAEIQTCWMKQRYGWVATPDNDFVSGFKNQGPFYQQKTNLVGGAQMCEIGDQCRINTGSNEECEAVCNLTDYCYGWSRGKNGVMDGMCQMKNIDGWSPLESTVYDSGFQGGLFQDTHLRAQANVGNFICDQQTPVYPKE